MAREKTYLRTLLLQRVNWFEERVLEKAVEHGYRMVTPAMARLFGHMGGKPAGLSELARRMGISRQAVHRLASEAIELGLIEALPSPQDARVVRLQFTQAGWVMSARAAKDFDAIEGVLKDRIGARNVAELKRLLALAWDGFG
jgi:DNA-binding MarR family transcriptional regulator